MFFFCDLKSRGGEGISEDPIKINLKYITNRISKEDCISSIIKYYEYSVIVITNYKEDINELSKKNSDNKCIYNSL